MIQLVQTKLKVKNYLQYRYKILYRSLNSTVGYCNEYIW